MNFYEIRDETNYLIGFYKREGMFKRLSIVDAKTKKEIIARLKDDYQVEYEVKSLQMKNYTVFEATIYLRTLE